MKTDPITDCRLCDRLYEFRVSNRERHPDFFNGAVPTWGAASDSVELLIIGLAPGLRGANRTGRVFTGDFAGDILYSALLSSGFAVGDYAACPDDSLQLRRCAITNAVRCVPPANKPVGLEVNTCREFLVPTIRSYPNLRILLTLGVVSHTSTVRALGGRVADYPFSHGGVFELSGYTLVSSYHCSRYNINTGRLTASMFDDILGRINELL